jgi:cyclase
VTLAKRVIVCLDVAGDRVVKGIRFSDLRDVGDPAAFAARYEAAGADELVFLDVSATVHGRATMLDTVRRTAERAFVPLTVGGGITSVDDAARALRAGADKVAVNSAAVNRPALLTELSGRFGAQCVVASIDVKRSAQRWEELTRAVADAVTVPVIASGGAGTAEHLCDVFTQTAADAALIAGVVHDDEITIDTIKRALAARNVLIRDAA